MTYPQNPGHQPHSETSRAAAEAARITSKRQAEDIFDWMRSRGMSGATIDEGVVFLSSRFGRDMQASPRFRQLELAGRIVKTEDRRKTRTGQKAVVYRVAHIGPNDPPPPIQAPAQYAATPGGFAMGTPARPVEISTYQKALNQLARTGHGHVVARRDGVKTRCGGPGICRVCSTEKAYLDSTKGQNDG